jgi:hypothetical protein
MQIVSPDSTVAMFVKGVRKASSELLPSGKRRGVQTGGCQRRMVKKPELVCLP